MEIDLTPRTFEGEPLALAAVAGAIIVTALVGGFVCFTWQASKAVEPGSSLVEGGQAVTEAATEAVSPD
jgi:hypothetical protein